MLDDCIICGKWPEPDRWALRQMISSLPLGEEQICDECLRSFLPSDCRATRADSQGKATGLLQLHYGLCTHALIEVDDLFPIGA